MTKAKTLEEISCRYTEGVTCTEPMSQCRQCGHNPIVSEIRIAAIKSGDTHFLRYSEDDFDRICQPLRKI